MQWSHDADAKLFMHVLKIHDVKINYIALATAMGNDVTPKAITHRIAKLRSMADDASTPTAAANSNSNSNPGPLKRNSPAKRAPATTTPATKKSAPATGANKTPVVVTGTKRNAAGTAKQGTNGNGKAAKDENAAADDEEGDVAEVKPSSANKKIKTSNADVKNGIKVFEDGSAAAAIAAVDEEGGVEYAA